MKERSSPEKQVFPTHYFLTMPHLVIEGSLGRGLLPSLTPCQPGSKHTRGEADGEKWDEAGNGCGWGQGRGADIIHSNTARLELVQR